MRGVTTTVGGVFTPTRFRRLPVAVAAVLVFVLISASVGSAQRGAAQPTQAMPSVPQAQTPTADELQALRQRAEQGDAAALCQLGTVYEDGQAVAKDSIEAAKWFSLGVMLAGDLENDCTDKRDRLKRQLPAKQYAEAQQRAKKWRETVGFTYAALRNAVKPNYTVDAMKAKITGDVELDFVIGIDGRVVQWRVVRSLDGGLDQEAIKALRQFRFAPARFGKRAVPTLGHVVLTFTLKE